MAYLRKRLKSPCGVRSISVDKAVRLYEQQYSVLGSKQKDGLKKPRAMAV
jgi:hypothetical protein